MYCCTDILDQVCTQANAWGILFIALSMFLLAVLTITLVFSEGIAEDNDLYDFAEGITGLKFSHIITPTIIELSGISFCALSFVSGCIKPAEVHALDGTG